MTEETSDSKQFINAIKACSKCLKSHIPPYGVDTTKTEWITLCDEHATQRRKLADKYGWAIR